MLATGEEHARRDTEGEWDGMAPQRTAAERNCCHSLKFDMTEAPERYEKLKTMAKDTNFLRDMGEVKRLGQHRCQVGCVR